MKYFFIGIDVSKEKLDATLIHYESESDSEQQLAYTTVENNPKGFKSLVSWSKKNAGRGVKTDAMPLAPVISLALIASLAAGAIS